MSDKETVDLSEIRFYECKFSIEHYTGTGNDYERNITGTGDRRRVSFEGYMSPELCEELRRSMAKVMEGSGE